MLVLCFNNSFITNINSENIAIINKYFFNNNSSKEEKNRKNKTIPERIKKAVKEFIKKGISSKFWPIYEAELFFYFGHIFLFLLNRKILL